MATTPIAIDVDGSLLAPDLKELIDVVEIVIIKYGGFCSFDVDPTEDPKIQASIKLQFNARHIDVSFHKREKGVPMRMICFPREGMHLCPRLICGSEPTPQFTGLLSGGRLP